MVEMQLSNVLLPDPEGPITPTNSPCFMVKLTPASALVILVRVPKYFSTFVQTSIESALEALAPLEMLLKCVCADIPCTSVRASLVCKAC